jgi:Fe-S-cluster containining protein
MSDKAEANRKAREARKAAYLRGMADRYAERFRAVAGREAPDIAGDLHGMIDDILNRDRGRSADSGAIQCRKGCDRCCRLPVEIWPQEAALLAAAARDAGIELDRARLERQSRHTIESWLRQPAADRTCVFLGDDGACRVYAARPNACRKLLVTSDPALCDTEKHAPGTAERWFSWESEMLELAALEVFGRGLMARLLLAELRSQG